MKVIRDGLAKSFLVLMDTWPWIYWCTRVPQLKSMDVIYRLGRMSDEEHAGILAT
jgi:hypothetical protein